MSREVVRHSIIVASSIAISAGSILFFAIRRDWQDGGRGGAIAVSLSLFSLFANRPHGEKIFRLLTSERDKFFNDLRNFRQSRAQAENYQEHIDRIIKAMDIRMDIDSKGQSLGNMFMSISAGFGTLAWGFGDWAAYLIQYGLYGKPV